MHEVFPTALFDLFSGADSTGIAAALEYWVKFGITRWELCLSPEGLCSFGFWKVWMLNCHLPAGLMS